MKKNEYQKPEMRVIKLQPRQIICLSKGVESVSNSEGLIWKSEGLDEDDN